MGATGSFISLCGVELAGTVSRVHCLKRFLLLVRVFVYKVIIRSSLCVQDVHSQPAVQTAAGFPDLFRQWWKW